MLQKWGCVKTTTCKCHSGCRPPIVFEGGGTHFSSTLQQIDQRHQKQPYPINAFIRQALIANAFEYGTAVAVSFDSFMSWRTGLVPVRTHMRQHLVRQTATLVVRATRTLKAIAFLNLQFANKDVYS